MTLFDPPDKKLIKFKARIDKNIILMTFAIKWFTQADHID